MAINEKLAGLISIADPIKPDAKDIIQRLQQAGLKVIMLSVVTNANSLRLLKLG